MYVHKNLSCDWLVPIVQKATNHDVFEEVHCDYMIMAISCRNYINRSAEAGEVWYRVLDLTIRLELNNSGKILKFMRSPKYNIIVNASPT